MEVYESYWQHYLFLDGLPPLICYGPIFPIEAATALSDAWTPPEGSFVARCPEDAIEKEEWLRRCTVYFRGPAMSLFYAVKVIS